MPWIASDCIAGVQSGGGISAVVALTLDANCAVLLHEVSASSYFLRHGIQNVCVQILFVFFILYLCVFFHTLSLSCEETHVAMG